MDELLRDKLNDDLINDTFGVSTKGVFRVFSISIHQEKKKVPKLIKDNGWFKGPKKKDLDVVKTESKLKIIKWVSQRVIPLITLLFMFLYIVIAILIFQFA